MADHRTFYPIVAYHDADRALEFLTRVFGFEPSAVHRDDQGIIVHAEMSFDTGIMMTGQVGTGSVQQAFPVSVYVAVDDVDAHHEHAVGAGARIIREPTDTEYGSRDYAVQDTEGNCWYFGTYRP